MVAEHPRVGARALLADGAQGILDIARIADPAGLQPLDLVFDLGYLALGLGEAGAAFLAQTVDLLQQADALGQGLLQVRGQLVVTVLLGAYRVQPAVQRAEIDPVPGQQLVEVGHRLLLRAEHCLTGLAPAAAGQVRQFQPRAVLAEQLLQLAQGLDIAIALLGLLQQRRHAFLQLGMQLLLAVLQLVPGVQCRNALAPCFQLHQLMVGLIQPLAGQALLVGAGCEPRCQLLLLVLGAQILALVLTPDLGRGGILQTGTFQPQVKVVIGLLTGLLQQVYRAADAAGFLLHAMHGAQQVADAADGIAEVPGFQHLLGDKLVDRAHRLVGHEIGEGAGGILGFADRYGIAAPAQGTVEPGQIGTLAVVDFHALLAELAPQQFRQLGDRQYVAAILGLAQEVRQGQHLPGDYHQQQFLLTGLTAAAGGIQMRAHPYHCRERLAGLAPGRMEHPGDIAIGVMRAGIGAIVAAEHVGGQGTHLLAAASALGGFVLAGVVVEQVVMGGGHQRLQRIGGRGLAGAVATGEQIDRAIVQLLHRQVAPIDGNRTFQIHQGVSYSG